MLRLLKCGLTIAGKEAMTAVGPATAADHGHRGRSARGFVSRGEASANRALIEASTAALTACSVLAWTLPEEPARSWRAVAV